MIPAIHAGFECAHLRVGQPDAHDLLASTGHLHPQEVRAHRDRFAALGFQGFRDALTPNAGRNLLARAAAYRDGDRVTWDLHHFACASDRRERRRHIGHAVSILAYLGRHHDDLVPFNEPSMHAPLNSIDRHEAIGLACEAMALTREAMEPFGYKGRLIACDPTHDAADPELDAIAAMLAAGATAVGVQHYAHDARAHLSDVLRHVAGRFPGVPVLISETGLHEGHPAPPHGVTPWIATRAEWLRYVLDEVRVSGVPVESVTWFPVLGHPPWPLSTQDAMRAEPWPCGWPEWVNVGDVVGRQAERAA